MILGIFNGWLDPVYIGLVEPCKFFHQPVDVGFPPEWDAAPPSMRVRSVMPVRSTETDAPQGIKNGILIDHDWGASGITCNFKCIINQIALGGRIIDLSVCGEVVFTCARCGRRFMYCMCNE